MGQKRKIQYWPKAENYSMSPKHKRHADGNAGNTSGPHDESSHAENTSGGHRGDSSCGPLVFRALASADVFCFWSTLYFSVFGPYCTFCRVCYQLPCISL